MPNLYVSESKTQVETISYFANFQKYLSSGETITSQEVTVSVFMGVDPSPSTMLYEGLSVINGYLLEQRIRQGIPGVIYSILFNIITSLGNTYNQETRLAILPNATGTVPIYNIQYETSTLYPFLLTDKLTSNISLTRGYSIKTPMDAISNGVLFLSGILSSNPIITYYIPPEGITTNLLLTSGVLGTFPIVSYNLGDNIDSNVALISGILGSTPTIIYYIPPESITSTIALSSGSLV